MRPDIEHTSSAAPSARVSSPPSAIMAIAMAGDTWSRAEPKMTRATIVKATILFFILCVCVCVESVSDGGENVNNLVEKVERGDGNLIFAPVFKLNESKRSVFSMFNFKNNDGLSAIVCELRGGVGGGVGHVQRIAEKRFRRKNFLHKK